MELVCKGETLCFSKQSTIGDMKKAQGFWKNKVEIQCMETNNIYFLHHIYFLEG